MTDRLDAPKFTPDRKLYPFASHYVSLPSGTRTHYVDEGVGPTLLLLHGNPTWSFLYRKMIPALARHFRCIAPDLPGFGLSHAPRGFGFTATEHARELQAFVTVLDLDRMTIFMQDWGGPLGFSLALRSPEKIDGFVIGNTFAWPMMREGQRKFSRLMGGLPGQAAAMAFNGIVRAFFRMGAKEALTRDEFRHYLLPFKSLRSRRPTFVFPRELIHAGPMLEELARDIGRLSDKPALLVWGMKDFAFQEGEMRRFMSIFPDHHLVRLTNAGHFIQEDAPAEIATAIIDWKRPQSDRRLRAIANREGPSS